MKVVIVTQYYLPENTLVSPTLAAWLQDHGHEVRVITGYPNYPEGRVFDGYRQRWRIRSRVQGIDVLRVPLYADHSQNALKRILNYVSFAITSATAGRHARGADVVYVYATQMTPALGPWLWHLLGGPPYVLHVQDLWPDSITGSSLVGTSRKGRLIDRILTPWLRSVYKRAGAVIGIAPTMVETLIERGSDPKKTHLVYNWAATADDASRAPRQMATGPITVIYGGNVGDLQDLDTAIRAAHAAADSGLRLLIVGEGVALPKLRALAKELGTTNVEFRGRVSREQVHEYYSTSHFALVSLKDRPNFRGTIPSKFQASLISGTPVISTVQGDLRQMIETEALGFTANAEDSASLEQAFRHASTTPPEAWHNMSQNGRRFFADQMAEEKGLDHILQILLAATQGPKRTDHE